MCLFGFSCGFRPKDSSQHIPLKECLSSAASKSHTPVVSHQRVDADDLRLLGRSVRPTRRITAPSAQARRLITSTILKTVPSAEAHRRVVNAPLTEVYRLLVNKALFFTSSEYYPTRAFLFSWRYQSKHLQAMPLEVRRPA